jgi:hypothetical protein
MWDYNNDGVIDDLDEYEYLDDLFYEEDMNDCNYKSIFDRGQGVNKSLNSKKDNNEVKFWPEGLLYTLIYVVVAIILLFFALPFLICCPPIGLIILYPILIPFINR